MEDRSAIAFYAFCPQGLALGRKLAAAMEGELYAPQRLLDTGLHLPDAGLTESYLAREGLAGLNSENVRAFVSLADVMAERFHKAAAHVFIGAAGIAVRAIAPHLRGKTVDPAVVVCEIHGRFVISLLSGHVGGANALARNLAERTGGQAIITTATDSEGLPALDILADVAHCHVADPTALKLVSAAILAGRAPVLVDPEGLLDLSAQDRALFVQAAALPPTGKEPAISVGVRAVPPAPGLLRLYARRLHVGVGYRRGVSAADLLAAIRRTLEDEGLAEGALAALATADIKRDDPAVRDVARALDIPLRFFAAPALAGVPVPHPSPKAAEVLGAGPLSVAEGAALLSAGGSPSGAGPRLVAPKRAESSITVAIARP